MCGGAGSVGAAAGSLRTHGSTVQAKEDLSAAGRLSRGGGLQAAWGGRVTLRENTAVNKLYEATTLVGLSGFCPAY